MTDLDRLGIGDIEAIDPSGFGGHLAGFPDQCRQAAEIGNKVAATFPRYQFRNVVYSGMGGSAMAGDILAALMAGQGRFPIVIHRNYGLPAWVGRDDLVAVASYSGDTEESLSAYDEARKRGTAIIGMSSGGELGRRCREDGVRCIGIPGGLPPRCALGYLLLPWLSVFRRSHDRAGQSEETAEAIELLQTLADAYGWQRPSAENPAKAAALAVHGRPVVLYATDRMAPVARRWANQINENAKSLAYWALFPELCHNEVVGWETDAGAKQQTAIVVLNDQEDHPRNKLRAAAVLDIVKPRCGPVRTVSSQGRSQLARMLSLTYLGDWVSYYLALLGRVDPQPVASIAKLKSILKEQP